VVRPLPVRHAAGVAVKRVELSFTMVDQADLLAYFLGDARSSNVLDVFKCPPLPPLELGWRPDLA
jgi:hypothetical protein